jgi:hypothetical protein
MRHVQDAENILFIARDKNDAFGGNSSLAALCTY